MTQSPRHAKASRAARRPALRAALVLPTVVGIVLISSAGGGALAAVGRLAPEALAVATPSASHSAGRMVEITDVVTVPDRSDPGSPVDTPVDGHEDAGATDGDESGAAGASETGGAKAAVTPGPVVETTAGPTASAEPTATSAHTAVTARTENQSVAVKNPGATYVSSSSTDRPLLTFSGWKDDAGRPLGSDGTVNTAVQVRIVDERGSAQSATIYPAFTNGRSEYSLPLWPFTQAMLPHVGTYTIEWRLSGADNWQLVDVMTMDVRLPEATAGSTLSYSQGLLTGTGWAFDRSTNIGGSFNVLLNVADAEGNAKAVVVRARFAGTRFTVTEAAFAAAGVNLVRGSTISATPTGGETGAVSVTISEGSGAPAPSTQPSAAPSSTPSAQPSAEPEPSPSPSVTSAAPATTPASPTPPGTGAPEPTPAPSPGDDPSDPATEAPQTPEPTAQPTATITPTEAVPTSPSPESPTAAPTSDGQQPGPIPTPFEALNEGVDVDPLIVRDPSNGDSQLTQAPATQQAESPTQQDIDSTQTGGDAAGRPEHAPTSPVKDAGELGPDNAGSLSGTRQGAVITLMFPSAKVASGEWVAVFVFPGATTPGWVQVDSGNSVSIDISPLEPGSYKIAVGDRNSRLLGWAQLEIAQAASSGADATGITLITGDALASSSPLGADGWKLVGAGLLLILGGVSFFVLARPTLNGSHARNRRR
ncbi:hypothetical protein [Actinomyces sp.]|uniref:hypothetical protein n=1 Tax=Actinomyces sp. TaxID=29317 RepID=UPI0026DC3D63|nr:hypothetical protein [Actinomyces sp.]MDO4900410.1 hypothetical protein [Actinomyces sp.]